jgi:hypothetical protein
MSGFSEPCPLFQGYQYMPLVKQLYELVSKGTGEKKNEKYILFLLLPDSNVHIACCCTRNLGHRNW